MVQRVEAYIPVGGVSQKGELDIIASEKKPGNYELMFALNGDTYSETVKIFMTSVSRGTAILYEDEKQFNDGGKETVAACLSLKESDDDAACGDGVKLKFEMTLCQKNSVTLEETNDERKAVCFHINETICAMQKMADELTGVGKVAEEESLLSAPAINEAVETAADYDEDLLNDIMSHMPTDYVDEIDQNELDALLTGL